MGRAVSPRSGSNGRSPGTVICGWASPIRRSRRSGSAVTVGARVPPPGIVQMACRKWIGKFKSCRGHYLTSADATPCKIHATRAIGVCRSGSERQEPPNARNPLARHRRAADRRTGQHPRGHRGLRPDGTAVGLASPRTASERRPGRPTYDPN